MDEGTGADVLIGEVVKIAGLFMQYYREHPKYLERTYGFVERITIEKLEPLS